VSYDLWFDVREGVTPPSLDSVKAWFREQPCFTVDENLARYANEETGFSFAFQFYEAEAPRAPVWFNLAGSQPHVLALEIEPTVRALVERFDLLVDDPQGEGMGRGEYDREKFLAGLAYFNHFVHRVEFGHIGRDVPPTLPKTTWDRVFAWNRKRAWLHSGDDVFVPRIQLHFQNKQAFTLIALAGAIPVLLPEVDLVFTPLGMLKFSAFEQALSKYERREEPAPHWVVLEPSKELEKALARPKKLVPALLSAHSVLTREIVEVEKAAGRAERMQEQNSRAAMAWNQGRYKESLAVAKELEGAQRAMIRAFCLGELARFDECEAAFEELFVFEPMNAMLWNTRGFLLDAAGKKEPSEFAYDMALKILEDELVKKPEDPTLWSRKAYALNGLGRAEEAKAAAERSLALKPNATLAETNLGRALMTLGDPAAARTVLEAAVEHLPDLPHPKFWLARACAMLGDTETATERLREIVKINPMLVVRAKDDPLLAPLLAAAKRKPKR